MRCCMFPITARRRRGYAGWNDSLPLQFFDPTDGSSHNGTAHVAFGSSDGLGPCDFKDFVAQSHTPNDHCVRFANGRHLPRRNTRYRAGATPSRTGLSPAGPRQLRLAHVG